MAVPAKWHFYMGFKKSKQFFPKIVMYRFAPRGPKSLKIEIFHENGLFSFIIFYDQLVAYPVIYYRKEL